MPDLARYAGTVLGAYAVTLALMALIVALDLGAVGPGAPAAGRGRGAGGAEGRWLGRA